MAKTYKLTFSDESAKVKAVVKTTKGIVEEDMPTKEVEKSILISLVKLAMAKITDAEQINIALDFLKQIKDADKYVIIDKDDLTSINNGIKYSVDKRPDIWYEATDFWKQLEKPAEQKAGE